MTTLTVRITAGQLWYENQVGQLFEVEKYSDKYFSVVGDNRRINKDDCVVVAVSYETAVTPTPAVEKVPGLGAWPDTAVLEGRAFKERRKR